MMTQKRQTALKYTLLTAAVGLIIICWLVLAGACGPSAPAEQKATSTDETLNTPTPENTPTDVPSPEPSPTPTPPVTPNMAKLGMYTEAVVSFLSVPTPGVGNSTAAFSGSSGADQREMVPGELKTGASGADEPSDPVIPPITLPPLITVSISTLDLEATRRFLEANGGAITESFQPTGAVNWVISADTPPALLPSLSQQQETLHAFVGVLYEKVHIDIGEMIVEYAVKKANNPGIGLGGIEAIVEATPEGYANVRRFLARHNLRLTYPDEFGKRHGFQIIPAGLILPISELPGVIYINIPPIELPAVLPESQHRPASPTPPARQVHGASSWHAAGITGNNVKVGIIDSGFYEYSTVSITKLGELPTIAADSDNVRCYKGDRTFTRRLYDCEWNNTDKNGTLITPEPRTYHGTAVAEALYDVAPGVELYISNASVLELDSTIRWMHSKGVKIINYSKVANWDGSGDGSSTKTYSPIAAIDTAASLGILWVNGAGNSGRTNWFERSYSVSSGNYVQFSGINECNTVTLQPGGNYTFQLRWAGNWGGRNKDLTAELWETIDIGIGTAQMLSASSNNVQPVSSNSDPYDQFSYAAPTAWKSNRSLCLKIKFPSGLPAADRPAWLQFGGMNDYGALGYQSSGYSILNPAESDNPAMLAVGAASWALTTAIEPFSSKGPLPEATRIIKPEIVGSDATFSETKKHLKLRQTFAGTSAAAPHVAGLAALVVQEHNNRTGSDPAPTRVVGFLKQHARDRGTPGPDNTWGAGFAYLPTLTPVPTPTPTPTPTPSPTPTLAPTPTPVPALGAPSGLTLSAGAGAGTVNLTWTPGANATKHWVAGIKQSDLTAGNNTNYVVWTETGAAGSYTVAGLARGVEYVFTVTAGRVVSGTNQWSAWTNLQRITLPQSPTAAHRSANTDADSDAHCCTHSHADRCTHSDHCAHTYAGLDAALDAIL